MKNFEYNSKYFVAFKSSNHLLELSYDVCWYFDSRPRIVLWLPFITMYFILPFHNKKWEDECDPPSYGITIWKHSTVLNLWWKWNGKWWNNSYCIDYPFVNNKFYRCSILLKDWTWEHEYVWDRKNFRDDCWDDKKMTFHYNYTDKYDWTVIPTTITVEEREWRPKWLWFTKLFSKVQKSIDVEFSKEVWHMKWSWKWWTIWCGYILKEWEHPLECIMRMEKDRNF